MDPRIPAQHPIIAMLAGLSFSAAGASAGRPRRRSAGRVMGFAAAGPTT